MTETATGARRPGDVMPRLRRLLLALLLFGCAATGLDLYLLEHYEDVKQVIPLALLAAAVVIVVWHLAVASAASVRVLQMLMVVFIVSGLVGMVFHYQGNMEFQLDIDPSLGGWALFQKVIHAKAPPAMAPGAMAQLGLLGLVSTYRHPAIAPVRNLTSPATGV